MKDKQRRVHKEFANEMDDIKRKRIALGMDNPNKPISDVRITRSFLLNPKFSSMKNEAIKLPRDPKFDIRKKRMNKRGALSDLFVWIIIGFITLIFFGIWIYGHNLLTNELVAVTTTGDINVSAAAQATFGAINASMPLLHTVSFVIFFGLGLSILVSNFLVRTHPVFFIVYLMFVVAAIILGAYVSNSYDTILANDIVGSTFQEFTASNFIMANLPIWATVIGIFGAILLFINMQRDDGLGGSIT